MRSAQGAFLHFHEDPAGLLPDAKLSGRGFQRFAVETADQQGRLLAPVQQVLSG